MTASGRIRLAYFVEAERSCTQLLFDKFNATAFMADPMKNNLVWSDGPECRGGA
jgi:hypothetical protein